MPFILKKIIGALLMPVTLLFLTLFTGLLLIWFSTKWQKAGKAALTAGISLFFLTCFYPVSTLFVQPLERFYPAIDQVKTEVDYIWVLGSGSRYDTSIPLHSRLYEDGLYRVLEGVRLYKQSPDAMVVFSGYGGGDSHSVAEVGAELAESLGVPKDHIIIREKPKDTWDEALAAKELIGDKPFILVTSAMHMKRSVYFFTKNGLNPVPAPCGHYIKKEERKNFFHYLPSAKSADMMRKYCHEQLGLFWLRILDWFNLTDSA